MFFVCSTGDVSRSIVALAVIGKFCITANFHALFVYTSEVYATPTRNTALSICSVFASAGGMAAPFVAQTASIHPTAPIAVFGLVSVVAGFLMSFLPETKGRPMPQTVTESEDMWTGDTFWNSRFLCCKPARRSDYEKI
jgi:OCT family organic cation transporter-like MFS transporter 4/5